MTRYDLSALLTTSPDTQSIGSCWRDPMGVGEVPQPGDLGELV
jgi:hypothetical protein